MNETVRASVSSLMSCEIYESAKLLAQKHSNWAICWYSRAFNLRPAFTKLAFMQNLIYDDVLVQYGHYPGYQSLKIYMKGN